jgi:hypothetical protein
MTTPPRKIGTETFKPESFQLQEFWQWNCSDLLSNTLRGHLAEFLVAKAVGAADGVRTEWDAVDVTSPAGVRIEVKSAAYVQSWTQSEPSAIRFDIEPKTSWDAETNTYDSNEERSADVYVFALLTEKDPDTINPLDLSHWMFYVISTTRLNNAVQTQKTIGLGPLLNLAPGESDFHGLNEAINFEVRT